jgi:predicted nucleotidyltransferase
MPNKATDPSVSPQSGRIEEPIDETEMAHYVARWRQRMAEQQAANERLAQEARTTATRIAAMLCDRFGVQRVILFGSVRKGGFAPGSDIDLAVEGLAKSEFFTALAEANQLSRFWVDLKPLEDVHPHFRSRILETGEDLL